MSNQEQISTKAFDLNDFSKAEIIKACLQAAFSLSKPIALWRLPHAKEIHFLTSENEAIKLNEIDFSNIPKGFLFSKFKQSTDSNYFIKGDYHLSFDYNEVNEQKENEDFASIFTNAMQMAIDKPAAHTPYYTQTYQQQSVVTDYEALVSEAIEAIKAGAFEKVVPARAKDVTLSEQFDVIDLFLRLTEGYENAFISFVSIPNVGSWLGATPEILIEKEDKVFRTVSLAGTKRLEEERPISETAWNQKEIEEQAMVSRFIINCFKKIRLREFTEKGPKTTKAGNLLHLKTIFEVDMDETNFSELPTVMLGLLHPTSAVAGMPKAPALAFINEKEGLDRSFYSGFLGPIAVAQSTHIFVNLRCMQLFEQQVRLYAGAGVTEDSNPEKEYLETEMKCNTLLNKIIHRV